MNIYLEKLAAYRPKASERYSGSVSDMEDRKSSLILANGLLAVPTSVGSMMLLHKLQTGNAPTERLFSPEDVTRYARYRGLSHVPWDRTGDPLSAHFNPYGPNGAYLKSSSNHIALHELGHAHSHFSTTSEKLRKAKNLGYGLSKLSLTGLRAVPAPIAAMAGTAVALSGEGSDYTAVGTAIPAAMAAPMLVEEARASVDPYRFLRKHGTPTQAKAFGKSMGKAFGTYGAMAAGSILTPLLAKSIYHAMRPVKKKPEE